MIKLQEILAWLEQTAPLRLSEAWDNTGLLLGNPDAPVSKVLTCLTVTPESVAEAVDQDANLVIAHHPMPFKPLKRMTTESYEGGLLWQLASHGIALYAPHTAWDSANFGINAQLATRLDLDAVEPLIEFATETKKSEPTQSSSGEAALGSGRVGNLRLPTAVADIAAQIQSSLTAVRPRGVLIDRQVTRVAVACGSGGSFLSAAVNSNADLLVTGESTFHTCLEAKALGISLLMVGHFASERFSMEQMAASL
ncbi:MAG: Nif3-like dinuclear metal center hexameric protein, partial [Planctomycetota bacterium]